jgi:D-alanyl-D-alanine carboxypeptidase
VRAVKAASLLERGFNGNTLSWLTPSLGSVESLQPITAAPPNLREEMCGKHRKRPAAESEDADDAQANAATPGSDTSSPHGVTLSTLRAGIAKPSTLLGPLQPSMEPVVVYVGPSRNKGQADTQLAGARSRKGVPVAAAGAAAAVAAVPGAANAAKPQVNVPAFAAAPPNYPSTNSFTPPSGAPGYSEAGGVPVPKPRPRLAAKPPAAAKPTTQTGTKPATAKPAAAKPAGTKPAAVKPDNAKPAAKPAAAKPAVAKPSATKPAAQAAAKPAATAPKPQ